MSSSGKVLLFLSLLFSYVLSGVMNEFNDRHGTKLIKVTYRDCNDNFRRHHSRQNTAWFPYEKQIDSTVAGQEAHNWSE